MEYKIKRIQEKKDIYACEKFQVSNFQWVEGPKPKTWGYMGYLEGEGLYVEMFCEETEPRRICEEPWGRRCQEMGKRVCDDSAMEAFLAFGDENGRINKDSLYVNFEINSNGVLYGAYGRNRVNRSFISEEVYEKASPKSESWEKGWKISMLFPEDFLREVSGVSVSDPGNRLFVNFYKISETPEFEHYGTFARIDLDAPDFHVPAFFAQAVVE